MELKLELRVKLKMKLKVTLKLRVNLKVRADPGVKQRVPQSPQKLNGHHQFPMSPLEPLRKVWKSALVIVRSREYIYSIVYNLAIFVLHYTTFI